MSGSESTDAGSATVTTITVPPANETASGADAGSATVTTITVPPANETASGADAGSATGSTITVPSANETAVRGDAGSTTGSTITTVTAPTQAIGADAGSATQTTTSPSTATVDVHGIISRPPGTVTTVTPTVPETTFHLIETGTATRTAAIPVPEPGVGVNIDTGSAQETTTTPLPSSTSAVEVDWPSITDLVDPGERIDEALASLDDDHVTVEFPPGTYELGEFRSNSDDIELVAPQGSVTLKIVGDGDTMLAFSGEGWSVQGFDFDFRDRSPKQLIAHGSGWAIRNCVWRGAMDWSKSRPSQAIAARVDYDDGTSLVHGCYFHDGTTEATDAGYGTGVRVLPDNIGLVQVTESWFEDFAEGAVDGRDSVGGVLLERCYVRNSTDAVQVSAPATIQSCVFVNDDASPESVRSGRSEMRCAVVGDVPANDRGAEVYIGDCDFTWARNGSTGHAIDALTADSDIRVEGCRANNLSDTATVGLGGGSLSLTELFVSGGAPPLRRLGGLVSNQDIVQVSIPASNRAPPLSSPPPVGLTPTGFGEGGFSEGGYGGITRPESDELSRGRVVKIGRPGGSSGRFTG